MAGGRDGAQEASRPPTVAQQQVAATREQTAELSKIRALLEEQAEERRPAVPTFAELGQRMTWDGDNATQDRSLKWVALLNAYPALARQFARIPDSYWTRETEKEEGAEVVMAVVSCPCGTDTIVELGDSAECCGTLKNGDPCKRFYVYLVDRVFVTNSPKSRKAPWEAIVDDHRRSSRSDA